MELRAMMSRWDSLRARWALTPYEEPQLLGGTGFAGPVGNIASWRPARMEQRMRLLLDLGAALDALLVDERRIRAWLRRPLASLDGRRPIDAMSTSPEWIRALRRAALDFTP